MNMQIWCDGQFLNSYLHYLSYRCYSISYRKKIRYKFVPKLVLKQYFLNNWNQTACKSARWWHVSYTLADEEIGNVSSTKCRRDGNQPWNYIIHPSLRGRTGVEEHKQEILECVVLHAIFEQCKIIFKEGNTRACGNESSKYVGSHDSTVYKVLFMHMWAMTMALK